MQYDFELSLPEPIESCPITVRGTNGNLYELGGGGGLTGEWEERDRVSDEFTFTDKNGDTFIIEKIKSITFGRDSTEFTLIFAEEDDND